MAAAKAVAVMVVMTAAIPEEGKEEAIPEEGKEVGGEMAGSAAAIRTRTART